MTPRSASPRAAGHPPAPADRALDGDAEGATHTSALVLTLDTDEGRRHRALFALSQRADLEAGPLQEDRLPVVLQTHDADTAEATCRDLSLLEGVLHVEIVFIGLSDLPDRNARERTP